MEKISENIVTLIKPITRGEQVITDVTLLKPNAGTLRGVSLASVANSDVDALIKVLPRMTMPSLTEQEAALYNLLKGNTRAMRRAVRAGKVARKAAVKKAFTTMLDTLAVDGQADIPRITGLSLESMKLVLELMAEDAGVELFFLGSTVTV